MKWTRSLIHTSIALGLASFFSSCGIEEVASETTSSETVIDAPSEEVATTLPGHSLSLLTEDCPMGLSAFQASVHTMVRARCAACHDSPPAPDAPTNAPKFAVQSAEQSYASLIRLQNFDNIANGRFVTYGGNNHCHDYAGGQFDCNTSAADLGTAVNAWWNNGEKDCPRKGRFFTLGRSLPASLPDRAHGFMRLRWQLAASGLLQTSFLEMEGQLFSARTEDSPETFRFRKPRIVTPTRTVHIKDVKVLANGNFNPLSDSFRAIDVNVAPQGVSDPASYNNAPVLSSEALFVFNESNTAPEIAVSFEEMNNVTTAETCRAADIFTSGVLPALNLRNCSHCHGGNGQVGRIPANSMFNMNLTPAALCVAFKQRMSKSSLSSSPAVNYPLRSVNGHPRMLVDDAEASAIFGAWRTAEFAPVQ